MAEPLLSVREIHTYYGDSYVLQGVSLDVPAGAIVAILGRNGMGKTTLIRSVAGLTPPRRGDILFKGASLAGRPPYRIAQAGGHLELEALGRPLQLPLQQPQQTVRLTLEQAACLFHRPPVPLPRSPGPRRRRPPQPVLLTAATGRARGCQKVWRCDPGRRPGASDTSAGPGTRAGPGVSEGPAL